MTKQVDKRDALVMMYSYAKEYVDERILNTKHDAELSEEYKVESEQMQVLFTELFDLIHNGKL